MNSLWEVSEDVVDEEDCLRGRRRTGHIFSRSSAPSSGRPKLLQVHTSLQASNCLVLSLPLISLRYDRRDAAAGGAVAVHCHTVISLAVDGLELK